MMGALHCREFRGLQLVLGLEMTFVRRLAGHVEEDELAYLGTRNELQRLVRGVEDLQNLTVVYARVHEASSDVNQEAQTSESRAALCMRGGNGHQRQTSAYR